MELEILTLSEISQFKKPNISYSCSFWEPRLKMIVIIIIIGCEFRKRIVCWESTGGERRKEKDSE
jgi:hypothetical protein